MFIDAVLNHPRNPSDTAAGDQVRGDLQFGGAEEAVGCAGIVIDDAPVLDCLGVPPTTRRT